MLLGVGIITASCNVYEDFEGCPSGFSVQFVYTYNMMNVDAFAEEVNNVTLFIFDENGLFVKKQYEEGEALKKEGYRMLVDLEPGTYQLVTWAGMNEKYFECPDLVPGESVIEDLKVKTVRLDDQTEREKMDALWHSYSEDVVVKKDVYTHHVASLVKNTNKLRVILQNTQGKSLRTSEFDFTITADNGYMNYDNNLLPDPEITYLPYVLEDQVIGEEPDGLPLTAAVAEMNTMRLMENEDYRLLITRKNDRKIILNVNLNSYLLLTKMEEHDMSPQEYLDRQDEYTIIFFLTPSDTAEGGYVCLTVSINGWTIRLNEGEL